MQQPLRTLTACLIVLLSTATVASAAPLDVAELASRLDAAWVMVAAALVLMMQIGFLLLEAGAVRTKNAVNVAQKNLLDMAFAALAFFSVGFMIGFGPSHSGLPIGFDTNLLFLRNLHDNDALFFVFQVMFCGTAATIVSGAVAERMKLSAYVVLSFLTSAIVYPIFVHWAWGAARGHNPGAWLANLGFVDFAGSTVVHSTGAWIALAACIVLGARMGRFDESGKPVRFIGHSPVLSAAGTLMLFVGWIGFNGGSTLAASPAVADIVLNTVIAGAAGGGGAYAWFHFTERAARPEKATNGMVGGLVAITAGCHLLDPASSALVGLAGGIVASWANGFLERRLRIDDAVGAIGAHGFAGVLGTLSLAILAPASRLPTGSHLDQLMVQGLGAAVNFTWAFGSGMILMLLLNRMTSVRVGADAELRGLNLGEHQTPLGTSTVENAMRKLVNGDADLSMRLLSNPGDEAQDLADVFNDLMNNLQQAERKRRQQADQRRSEEEANRLATFADATFEALLLASDHRVIDVNSAAESLFGLPAAELRGRSVKSLFPAADWLAALSHLEGDTGRPAETGVRDDKGQRVPVEFRCRSIDYAGRLTQVLAFADLRERKEAEARIYHLAMHDPLTNLPNRANFNQRLRDLLGRLEPGGNSVALLLIDLDRFKNINDLHGHPSGDAVIVAVAERLRAASAPGDCVARLGGDEFAFVQAHVDFPNQAADLAHRILKAISEPVLLPTGETIRPAASVGVALAPRDAEEAEDLFHRCDVSLYAAKNNGRNTYAVYEPGMGAELRRRQEMEEDLKLAVEEEQFELHFQPRLDVTTRSINSYEALLRWEHPTRGPVLPSDFIPIAEQSNLIVKIGEWALRTACRVAAEQFENATVSVNVSPRQFQAKGFADVVRHTLQATGLMPACLELEVTESLFIDNSDHAFAVLSELKAMGVRVALDDFGTGYSSLSYVKRFPFNTIKIDQSFIREMNEDANALHIIDTILRLSSGLGMSVVAEGVENESQLSRLVAMGCAEIQGYFVSRPMPLSHLPTTVPQHVLDILKMASADTGEVVETLDGLGSLMRRAPTAVATPKRRSA